MFLIIYICVKIVIYTLWCAYGIRLMTRLGNSSLVKAASFAAVRIAIGFVLGLGWALFLGAVAAPEEPNRLGLNPVAYVAGLLVLRWIVWSSVSFLIRRPTTQAAPFGVNWPDRFWRLGGVALSFVGDIFVIAGVVGSGEMIC